MGVRLTWTECDEAGDYVVTNVLSPRDLASRLDNMDELVLHTTTVTINKMKTIDKVNLSMMIKY